MTGPFTVDSDTPLGQAIRRARAAVADANVSEVDTKYVAVTELTGGGTPLWRTLAVEHVAKLLELHAYSAALARCTEYLAMPGGDEVALHLPRAEVHSTLGQHGAATKDTTWIRTKLNNRLDSLTEDDRARLLRVEGRAAAGNGDHDLAKLLLEAARDGFRAAGNAAGVAEIEADLRAEALSRGDPGTAAAVLAAPPPRTPVDQLLLAMAHKSELRYEQALEVLNRLLDKTGLDPAVRRHVRYERLLLLLLLKQVRAADTLLGELVAEVETADDPVLADAVRRLANGDVPVEPVSARFDRRVQHARRLISDGKLHEADQLLTELHAQAESARDTATWHLVSGELELARPAEPAYLWKAAGHFEQAVADAEPVELAEVRVLARRRLGTVQHRLGAVDQAMTLWHEADALARTIAHRQLTDKVRVALLAASPTNHDMQVDAIAAGHDPANPDTTAAIVVAMEAARRATLVDSLVASAERRTFARDLPAPTDRLAASRWVAQVTWTLPRSQAIWLMHPVPGRVHHTLVGRGGLLRHLSAPVADSVLTAMIAEHVDWLRQPELLVPSIIHGKFDRIVDDIASLIGIDEVLAELPPHVTRIALAPARELAEVAFAALPIGGTSTRLGDRFALSYLLCLSARQPLHHRSRRQRGEHTLLVRPPAADLQPADSSRVPDLAEHEATAANLRAELAARAHQIVRIDGHGEFGGDGSRGAWLQLAPHGTGDDGRLRPEALQTMDLSGCGTVILGACDSGMAERRGQEERFGFVRAALVAGGSSVLAAEWKAHHLLGAAVLDQFEHYLRFLPRDVALRRAQRDVCHSGPDVPFFGHPAYWACWSLFGDTGVQTHAGPVRRLVRKTIDAWRNRAQPR